MIAKYLSDAAVEKTASSFRSVLQGYPKLSIEQLENIGTAISEVIDKQDDIKNYTPVSKEDFWKQILNKPKRS